MESSDPFWSIRENRNTGLENQKAAIDMLDAVEKTMKERALEASPENYFKSLWPLLDKAERIAGLEVSVVYLCHFVFPHLSADFIRSSYSELFARLPGLLKDGIANAPFMRSALSCLKSVLLAFEEKEAWASMTSLSELLSIVLGLCLDERPKVRKCAQDCITAMLGGWKAGGAHPGLSLIGQFIKLVLQGATRKDSGKALHLAPLSRKLIPFLDQGAIDGLLGPMLQCCGLGNGHLTVAYFAVLQELCRVPQNNNVAEEEEEIQRLVQLNLGETKKILEGLARLKPASFELAEISAAWIGAFGSCLAHPSLEGRLEQTVLNGHLQSLFEGLSSSKETVLLAAQVAFSILPAGSNGLPELLLERMSSINASSSSRISLPYLLAIVRDQIMLMSSNASAMALIEGIPPTFASILEIIGRLHDEKGNNEYRSDCVKAIHDFIRVFGPEPVLHILPLNLEPKQGSAVTISRAWLLPIMKEAIWNVPLDYFIASLLPLADRLCVKGAQFKESGKLGDAKVYETIVFQIWSLVPSFLRYPVGDFARAFSALAPRLASMINEDPILRPSLINALTSFIERSRSYEGDMESGDLAVLPQLIRPISLSAMESQVQVMQSLAPQFLPLLFNLLGVTKPDQRISLLRCIRAFLEISEESTVQNYFTKVSSHVGGAIEGDEQQACCLFELLSTMVPFLGEVAYAQLAQLSLPVMAKSEGAALQKAAYKALHLVLSHEMFGSALLHQLSAPLEEALINGGSLIDVSAVRKCRFRLLLAIVPMLPDDGLHWIPIFLPEVILGTKEVNQKTRLLAFELLLAFARRMSRGGVIRSSSGDVPASIEEYLTMVLAGLAGKTPHMISATVISLARLLFELATSIPSETLHAILGDILLLFGSPSKEIVKAAFGYVKVAVIVLPNEQVAPHLASLLSSILAWSGEHSMHFKVRVRHLLERLIRKFGYEAIAAIIPEEHHKLITNIKKRKDRAKRQKDEAKKKTTADHEDEDDDAMDLDRITSAALSTQTSMMTRRGVSSTATATRPSARFEAALYDSESDIEASSGSDAEAAEEVNGDDDDLEMALSKKLSLKTRALTTAKSAKTSMKPSTFKTNMKKTSAATFAATSEDFKLNPEGKMIIEDSDAEVEEDEGVVVDENAHRLYEQSLKTFSRPGKHVKFSQKRSRQEDDDEEEEDYGTYAPSLHNKSTISRLSKVSRRPATAAATPRTPHSGQEFKAKRGAGGDVKPKKSKVEPYAYVPLQRSAKGQKSSKNTYFLQKQKKH